MSLEAIDLEASRRADVPRPTFWWVMLALVIGELVVFVGARVFLPGGRSRVRQARSDAMTVRSAAEMYLAEDPHADCPTMDDLVDAHIINSATNMTDPWGNPFDIRCDGTEISVSSAGMRERGGDDDG